MAEVHDPAGETPTENDRRAARPVDQRDTGEQERSRLLPPPTDEELAAAGEPTPEQVHAAAGSSDDRVDRVDPLTRRLDSVPPDPVDERDERVERVEAAPAAVRAQDRDEPAAAPVATAPIEPAAERTPPPKARGNRVVGVAWVLLAAGIFQVLFFATNALVALIFGGTAAVVPQLQSIANPANALAWLPVLLFFLLFLLTVLIAGRAGRVAYVFTSLIVGAAVYVATVLLFSLIVRHTLGDSNTLAQTFLNWEFILIGLVARETMLWTGLAIGSRGIRVRRRNREARKRYQEGLADARD